jgi:hypothetical protein
MYEYVNYKRYVHAMVVYGAVGILYITIDAEYFAVVERVVVWLI